LCGKHMGARVLAGMSGVAKWCMEPGVCI